MLEARGHEGVSSTGGLIAAPELRSLPNLLTASRLVLIAVLWVFALRGEAFVVGVGLAVAFATDVLDGFAARRLGKVTAFGSRFDSMVDGVVGPSAIAWILLLRPEVVTDHLVLACTWALVTYASLVVGLVRHRRFANLHLRSARIACVAQYAFLVDVFVTSAYSPFLLYLAAAFGIYASFESLALQSLLRDIDERERSLLRALARRRAA